MTQITRRLLLGLGVACLGGALAQPPAMAQAYPSRPVKVLVGTGPGGTADLYARMIAQHLTTALGQPYVVENRPGADSTIAGAQVAQAPADGYTLLLGGGNILAINPHLMRKPYDHIKDFQPVSLFAVGPLLLVAKKDFPASTVAQTIAYAKANPDKLNFGSPGRASGPDIAGELLKMLSQSKMTTIPYKGGSGQMLVALIAGEVDLAFDNITSSLPHVRNGNLRALAVSSAERWPTIPDVPTVAEAIPGFEMSGFHGILAPANTPQPIVAKLSGEIARMTKLPEIANRVRELGGRPVGSTPDEFKQKIALETEKAGKVIREAKITLE